MQLSSTGGESLNLGGTGAAGSGLAGAGLGAIGGGAAGLILGALLGQGGFGGWGGRGVSAPAATAVATDIVLNPAFQSLQNQISGLASTVTTEGIARSFDQTQGLVASTGAITQNLVNGVSKDVATGSFTTLNSINGLGRDVTAQANQNALQQLNSFNALTTTLLTGFNTSAMQVQNTTNQIIAQGTALSAQLANCCCDIQKAIASDGDETRALINSINLANINSQLSDAKAQISNFNQTQSLLTALARTRDVV